VELSVGHRARAHGLRRVLGRCQLGVIGHSDGQDPRHPRHALQRSWRGSRTNDDHREGPDRPHGVQRPGHRLHFLLQALGTVLGQVSHHDQVGRRAGTDKSGGKVDRQGRDRQRPIRPLPFKPPSEVSPLSRSRVAVTSPKYVAVSGMPPHVTTAAATPSRRSDSRPTARRTASRNLARNA